MVECGQCGQSNRLDSRFCRACGARLPEEEIEQAKATNERMVADGRRWLDEGRVAEASLLAADAVDTDPESIAALRLVGDCHEREGRLEEAYEAFEKVTELEPDSHLDRVRLAHLRHLLTDQTVERDTVPNRRTAILVACVAAAVTLTAGAAAMWVANQPDSPEVAQEDPTGELVAQGFDTTGAAQSETPMAVMPAPEAASLAPDAVQPLAPNASPQGTANQNQLARPNPLANVIAPSTGRVDRLPSVGPQPIPPFAPSNAAEIDILPPSSVASVSEPQTLSPTPSANVAPQPTQPAQEEETPSGRTPIVDIRPSAGSPAQGASQSLGGAEPQTANSLLRVANQRFSQGAYADAIDHYQRALRAGGPAGTIYQRIGQAHQEMRQNSQAIAAYRNAIRALERNIRDGRGDPDYWRSVIDSCQSAIRALGG